MARIVHEQQLLICDLNERLLLKLEGEKERERQDEMSIQNEMFDLGTISYDMAPSVVGKTARGGVENIHTN
jgi:hypothetical protein